MALDVTKYSSWGWSGSGYTERIYFRVNHVSTDVLNNRTRYRLRVWNNSWNSFGDTGAIVIEVKRGGSTIREKTLTNQKTTGYNQQITYDDYYFYVSHGSDGSLTDQTFTLSITRAVGTVRSASVEVKLTDLPTIPRASSITTFNNFTIGSNIPWVVDRKYSAFTHKIELIVGGTVIASQNSTGASGTLSVNLTAKEAILNKLSRTSKSVTATLRVTTYTNSNYNVQVGSASTDTATGTANDNDIAPSFTSISHSENVTAVSNLVGAYVKDKSRLNLAINGVSSKYGATISSYRLTVANQVINSRTGTTGPINASGTVKVTGRVVDSRGIAVTADIDINVLNYASPKIEDVSFNRCLSNGEINPFGEYVKVEFKTTITSLKVGTVEKNKLTTKILSKQAQHSTYTEKNSKNHTTLTYQESMVISGYLVDYSYNFIARALDVFSEAVSVYGVIGLGEVTMHWSSNQVAVGKMIPDLNSNIYAGPLGIDSEGPINDKNGHEVLGLGGTIVDID